jgi:phospho-N-acetylmuramoyl-pentapeptide-transferase
MWPLLKPLIAFLIALTVAFVLSRSARRAFHRFRSREEKEGKEYLYRVLPRVRKPLGGGLAILAGLVVAVLVAGRDGGGWPILLLAALGFGAIGLADDWRKASGRGLSQWQKIAAQAAVGSLVGWWAWAHLGSRGLHLPFLGELAMGPAYIAAAVVVLVAASNAVNLTDGIDGLAGGSVAIAALSFALLSRFLPGPGQQLLAPSLALAGACLGFLAHNLPPARLIMGDAGALALGAALGALAIIGRVEWLLIPIGGVFVIDAASVLVQTFSIRLFRRPVRLLRHQTTEIFRPFLCAPIHHHFQWLAWPTWRILALFWGTGVVLGLLALPAFRSGWAWVAGLAAMALFLVLASVQKLLTANFFLGLHATPGDEPRVAVFRGWPALVLGRALYRLDRTTRVSEAMLSTLAADSILWRPISEIEAAVVLGKIYAEHRLYDEAIREWERVPLRNLLLRESVVLRLARLYYAKDWLLKAIQLWERLPESRLRAIRGLEDSVRGAKVRLAQLASKSYQQALQLRGQPRAPLAEVNGAGPQIKQARRFNEDLLSLLAYEREQGDLAARVGGHAARNDQQRLFRRMERTVVERLRTLDRMRAEVEASQGGAPAAAEAIEQEADGDQHQEALRLLGLDDEQLAGAFGLGRPGEIRLREIFADRRRASRNTVFRVQLQRRGERPLPAVAKCYDEEQISFFAACYRRERSVLEMLARLGARVPPVLGGHLGARRAVLFLGDCGEDTLADLLVEGDPDSRRRLLARAIDGLVDLHARARQSLPEIAREIRKIAKESLDEHYYLDTVRIALARILADSDRPLRQADWYAVREQWRPVLQVLLDQPRSFIHFEYVPHNLLVREGAITPVDFEQATLGPHEFDLVALLKAPECDLSPAACEALIEHYVERLQATGEAATVAQVRQVFDYANLVKGIFYAGAAAHFHARYGEPQRLDRRDWHLRDCDAVLARHPELATLRGLLMVRLERDLKVPLQAVSRAGASQP